MNQFWKEIRRCVRILLRRPGFSSVGVLTLALGIGANTAIFSAVNAILLRQLPFRHASRIVWITGVRPVRSDAPFSLPDFLDYRDDASGHFRFVNFRHPPPVVFSADSQRFTLVDSSRMVQFAPLGLQIPEDHPDRNRYFSLQFRQKRVNSTAVAEIALMSPGDILFLYTDEFMTAATTRSASCSKR